jgi:hypothetical protein
MPSTVSPARRRKAFDEGRRAAASATAENPYDNPTLRRLWDLGRAQQAAGVIQTPIPPLKHGETRAQRATHNPPGSKARRSPPPPRRPQRRFDRRRP